MITSAPCRPRGVALLVLLAVVAVGALTLLLRVLAQDNPRLAMATATSDTLADARQALLAWSASHPDLPGQLPCPEDSTLIGTVTEGQAQASCTLPAAGRLPWRTLGLPPLRDANGDLLWYAVSPGFRSAPINSATAAQLSVDGVAASAVAIVFSPGPRWPGQDRPVPSAAAPPRLVDHLEGSNADGDASFVSQSGSALFNDRLLVLRKDALMRAVEVRVAGEVAQRLGAYYRGNYFFPYAAATSAGVCASAVITGSLPQTPGTCTHPVFPTALGGELATLPPWFGASNWASQLGYKVAAGCTQATPGTGVPPELADCGGAGRLTVASNSAVKATLTLPTSSTFIIAP
jgi:hypothetical protein